MKKKPDPAALALALEARYLAAGNHVPPDSWPEPLRLQEIVRTLFPPVKKRLESLDELRQAFLPVFRDVWLRAGLACGPTDRPACEAAARLAYECAGLKPPGLTVWLRSPLEGAVGAVMLSAVRAQVRDQVGDQVWDQVGDQVWDQVGDQVRDQVWDQVWDQVGDRVGDQVRDQVGDQVGDQVWDQVRDQVWAQVRAQVRDQVWDQVGDQVWDQVRAQVRDQVWDQVGDQVRDQVGDQVRDQVGDRVNKAGYGSHDASWLAFYAFFHAVGLPGLLEKLAGLLAMSRCGWWWPFKGAVILSDLPTRLEMLDGKLRLIEYADGFRVEGKA